MLPRVLEPEVMDTAEEAADYDAMDHRAVNGAFCIDFLEAAGRRKISRILDVGTGTALIPIDLCGRAPAVRVVAIDLAEHMLARARENVRTANLESRISLELLGHDGAHLEDLGELAPAGHVDRASRFNRAQREIALERGPG